MNLLQQFNAKIQENAAGGAVGAGGSVGGMAMPLFSRLVQRTKPKAQVAPTEEPATEEPILPVKKNRLRENFIRLKEDAENGAPERASKETFDTTEVIAKLKSLENRTDQDIRDTVTFGLEDDKKGLVRVIVKQDQAESFEKALQAFMAPNDEEYERPEIAEVLFRLKDRFDLVDVQWPEIEEDEEEVVDMEGQPGEGVDMEMNPGEGELDVEAGVDDASATSLLQQVIGMMQADAEARMADAEARKAEARVKEANAVAKQASSRVEQEEQLLDMETYTKAQKEQEREAKKLAQLSRWKQSMDGGGEDDSFDAPLKINSTAAIEDEEGGSFEAPQETAAVPRKKRPSMRPIARGKIHPHEIANYVLNRVS